MAYPLGALCIQTALVSHEMLKDSIEVELSHFIADQDDPIEAAEHTAQYDIDLLGLSLYLYNRDWFNEFLAHLRKLKPHITIFAGGPETMADPKILLDSGIDILVLGEGEETVCDMVQQLMRGENVEGRGIQTSIADIPIPRYPSNLAVLPSPLLTGVANVDSYEGVLWEMTRGCPYHCAFCFESRGNRSVRTYPIERLQAELELLVEHDVKHVFVLDPTFNMKRERTIQLLTLIRDTASADMHFTFEIRAELLDEATAALFGQFHCSLQIGLQSSNPTVLESIGRNFNPTLFAEKISLLNAHGVVFGLDLIIGLPGDTLDSFRKSLDFAISCKPSNLDIFLLALLPGTQLAQDAGMLQLSHLIESPYLLQHSPTMDEKDIAEALRLKEACDLFYTKGRAVMWIHAACKAIGMSPSQWLSHFADFLDTCENPDEEDIFSIQDTFVRRQFGDQGLEHLLPAMLSYMELHQGIAHLQDSGEDPMVYLSYPPDDLALLDSMELSRFIDTHVPFEEEIPHLVFMEDDVLYIEPMQG